MTGSAPLAPTRAYLPLPEDLQVWSTLSKGNSNVQNGISIPYLQSKGLTIKSPKILGPPHHDNLKTGLPKAPKPAVDALPAVPPSEGFIVGGTIDVFGLRNVPGTLKTFHGPPPSHVGVSKTSTVFQNVQIDAVSVGVLFPDLAGTQFDQVKLDNVLMTYQSHLFDPTKAIGWHIEAKITIDESYGVLHDFLKRALGLHSDDLIISVYAYLGVGLKWNAPPRLASFSLQGVLTVNPSKDVKPPGIRLTDHVTLTQIGLRLLGVGNYSIGPGAPFKMQYEFEVFGEMAIFVPTLPTPLVFDYSISEFAGGISLSASLQGDIWRNAFGMSIDLDQVRIAATFPSKQPLKGLEISFSALFDGGDLQAVFEGSFSTSGTVNVRAMITDFTLHDLSSFFHAQVEDRLMSPEKTQITVGSATITISKVEGSDKLKWVFSIDHFEYDSYTCQSAIISRTKNGIQISGDLANAKFGDVTIESAQMHATFEGAASSRSSDVFLTGQVLLPIEDIHLDSTVHLFKAGGDALEWAVCCQLDALNPGKPLVLSRFFPVLQNSLFKDVALREAAFVVASSDDAELEAAISQPFPVKAGKQICAVVENVVNAHDLIPSKLFLSATWNAGFTTDLKLNLLLPSLTIIHFSKTMVTDPISIQLRTEAPFQLAVTGGLHVPVAGSKMPLEFDMILAIDGGNDPMLALSATLNTDWYDPFGISDEFTIRAPCSLSVDVNLYEFVLTGLPTGVGFQGGFDVGKSKAKFALTLSDDPDEELLKASTTNLAIADLVAFISKLFDFHIPAIPDFLLFVEANIYFSTGVILASTYYPAGFSMSGTMQLFGNITFSASAAVTNGNIAVKGSADPFEIGPLSLKGRNGGRASFDLELGADSQHAKIDACITFLNVEVDLFLEISVSPALSFNFDFLLKFTDLLLFQVDAKTVGEVTDPKNLSGLDFKLNAKFEQHILDYIRDQVLNQLEIAKAKEKAVFDKATATLAQAQIDYQQKIDNAQAHLDSAYASWSTYSDSVHKSSKAFIEKYDADVGKLQADLDSAQKNFSRDMRSAKQKLEAAKTDRASKMQAAQADVNKAKAKWDSDVQEAQNELLAAQQNFSQKFGSAEQDLENAEGKVNSLQSEVKSLQSQIDDYEGAPWYEFWKKAAIAGLYFAIGGVETAIKVADAVLEGCKDIVETADFATTKGAIPLAEKAVEDVGKAGDEAFQAAQATLQTVDKLSAVAVSLAANGLDLVEKGGQATLTAARSALDGYLKASNAALHLAQKGIDDLVRCTEWVAYKAASLALDLAKASTHALDVAKVAVLSVEVIGTGVLDIAEDIDKGLFGLLNVTRVELHGSFKEVINGSKPFTAIVDMTILEHQVNDLELELDLRNTGKLIVEIFKHFIHHPALKKNSGSGPGPFIPPPT